MASAITDSGKRGHVPERIAVFLTRVGFGFLFLLDFSCLRLVIEKPYLLLTQD
jgi:hypothetical protein